eukprot:1089783_1
MALCVWLLLVTIIPLSSAVIPDFPVHARAHPIVTAEQIADPSESDPDDNQKFVTVLMDCPVCAPHSKMKLHLWSKPANFREICGAFDDVRDSLSRHPDEGSSNDEEGSSSGDEESSRGDEEFSSDDEGSSRPQCAFANKGEDLDTLIDCLRHAVDAIEDSQKLRRSKHDYYRRRMPERSTPYDDSRDTMPGRHRSSDDSQDPPADQRGSSYDASASGDGGEEDAAPAYDSGDGDDEALDLHRSDAEDPLSPRHDTEEARGHEHRGHGRSDESLDVRRSHAEDPLSPRHDTEEARGHEHRGHGRSDESLDVRRSHERSDDSEEPPPFPEYQRDAPNLDVEVISLQNQIRDSQYPEALKHLLVLKDELATTESDITIRMEGGTSSSEDLDEHILPKFRIARDVLDVLFDRIFPHIMKDHIEKVLGAMHKRRQHWGQHKEDLLDYVERQLTQMLEISKVGAQEYEDRWKGFHYGKMEFHHHLQKGLYDSDSD